MACPFFMPVTRLENGSWPFPARLPLGSGWSGHCTASGHEGETPTPEELERFCNLGYATGCSRLPRDRSCDSVRFAVGKSAVLPTDGEASNRVLQLRYVRERDHRPVDHGSLEYDAGKGSWMQRHHDERVQKMAECFLESLLKKRSLQSEDAASIEYGKS
jgi:hypothetical protein